MISSLGAWGKREVLGQLTQDVASCRKLSPLQLTLTTIKIREFTVRDSVHDDVVGVYNDDLQLEKVGTSKMCKDNEL